MSGNSNGRDRSLTKNGNSWIRIRWQFDAETTITTCSKVGFHYSEIGYFM